MRSLSVVARLLAAAPKAPAADLASLATQTGVRRSPESVTRTAPPPARDVVGWLRATSRLTSLKEFGGGHIRLAVDTDSIAWVVMDSPTSSANTLNEAFARSLADCLEFGLKPLCEVRGAEVVVLASAKRDWLVGADVNEIYPETDAAAISSRIALTHKLVDAWRSIPVPTVAAIEGQALGGGMEIALACSNRIMAGSDRTQVGLPETLLGVIPGLGGTVRLSRLVGVPQALAMTLDGMKRLRPAAALKCGFADAVVPSANAAYHAEVLEGFRAAASKFCGKPAKHATSPASIPRKMPPMATKVATSVVGRTMAVRTALPTVYKRTLGRYPAIPAALASVLHAAKLGASPNADAKAFAYEGKVFGELAVSATSKNLMALYFLQEACKRGAAVRLPDGVREFAAQHVGVVGAGVMGAGIAHAFLSKGLPVYLKDVGEEALKKGVAFVHGEVDGAVKRKRMTVADAAATKARLHGGHSDDIYATMTAAGRGVIVEAAVERMDIKKAMVAGLAKSGVLDSHIFATNTSALSVAEIASAAGSLAPKVVGMHFFNPVAKMPLVEIIRPPGADPAAVHAVYQLALKLGKFPVVTTDSPGFLVNRVLGAFLAEAGHLMTERCEPRKVDARLRAFGLPMGAFRLLDEVGLDVAAHVAPTLANGLSAVRFQPSPDIAKVVAKGQLGRKTGAGFYKYSAGKQAGTFAKAVGDNTALAAMFNFTPNPAFDYADVIDRCVLAMVNEAAFALQDKVVATAEDVDLGMVFGTGFAPFRGGLLQYADHRGAADVVATLQRLEKKHGPRFAPAPMLVEMAKASKRFFPDRPFVPYKDGPAPKFDAAAAGVPAMLVPSVPKDVGLE